MVVRLLQLPRSGIGFVQRQTREFKLILARRALHGVADGLTMQYNSVYAVLLGADPVQLGSLESLGNAIGALASVPAGWFIDYYSLKKVFLVGTALLVSARLIYFAAPHWAWLYAGIVLYYVGLRVTCTSCTVTCATELSNEDRATGRGFCRTASSLTVIATPLLAAWIISRLGGIGVRGIRPLYALQVLIFLGVFVLLLGGLSPSRARGGSGERRPILSELVGVFRHGPDVVRLLLVMALIELPWGLAQPFMPVYAHQFKGANEFVLSGIYMVSTLVPMLCSIPLGRLADRHGRKKLLFAIAPLAYAANLCLISAPESGAGASVFVLLYGLFFGFNSISVALASSMVAEVMPKEEMGRWIGIVSLSRALLSVPAPLVGGLIWEHIGPEYVFLAPVAIDVLFRLPLLASARETLHLSPGSQS